MSDAQRDELNRVLHNGLGYNKPFDKPCESACTHFVLDGWTALGLANVLARRIAAIEAAAEVEETP